MLVSLYWFVFSTFIGNAALVQNVIESNWFLFLSLNKSKDVQGVSTPANLELSFASHLCSGINKHVAHSTTHKSVWVEKIEPVGSLQEILHVYSRNAARCHIVYKDVSQALLIFWQAVSPNPGSKTQPLNCIACCCEGMRVNVSAAPEGLWRAAGGTHCCQTHKLHKQTLFTPASIKQLCDDTSIR